MPAALVVVCKFDPSQDDDDQRYKLVPNVVCERIEHQVGPHAGTAHFRYLIDHTGLHPDWPTQFEEIWPQTAQTSQYVIGTDERIAVCTWTAEGRRILLFDGFAQIPQVNLSESSERITFVATSVACRAWDVPIAGRLQRDATTPNTEAANVQTDLPVRFNPSDGHGGVLPNCTPDSHDVDQSDDSISYPCFLEPKLERSTDPRTYWTLAKAVRYILSTANADEDYILNPIMSDLTDFLKVKVPKSDDGAIDPKDSNTYTLDDVPLRDFDASNQCWPDVLDKLLRAAGFGFFFSLPMDVGGDNPTTEIVIFRQDESTFASQTLLLDVSGSTIDPARSDVASLALARDLNGVVNAWSVETPPRRVEASFVLAPGFTPAAADATASNRKQFLRSRLADATSTIRRKYRWYVADECSDGHYDLDTSTFVTDSPIDLTPIFPDEDDGTATYVSRFRPGSTKLLTLDESEHPKKATLHYSQDYAGDVPSVWDGTGTWTEIHGGWRLLEDRLGIEVTAEDPEAWAVGKGQDAIKGITWQADPPSGKQFFLLLTTVIDDDIQLAAAVPARPASPTRYERRRRIDAHDHYRKDTVLAGSWFNQDADAEDIEIRDDTEKAKALARQYRTAHEMPRLSGSVVIPYITDQYDLADLVSSIAGRDVSLHTNAGGDKGEGKRYPYVTKIAWDFSGDRQQTTLQLTDLRAEPRA